METGIAAGREIDQENGDHVTGNAYIDWTAGDERFEMEPLHFQPDPRCHGNLVAVQESPKILPR